MNVLGLNKTSRQVLPTYREEKIHIITILLPMYCTYLLPDTLIGYITHVHILFCGKVKFLRIGLSAGKYS